MRKELYIIFGGIEAYLDICELDGFVVLIIAVSGTDVGIMKIVRKFVF